MPISYRIDPDQGILFVTIDGRFTDQDVVEHVQRLRADPDFRPTLDEFLDATGVTEMAITAAGNRAVAREDLFGPGARRAIVAPSDVVYGMARMYEILRHAGGEDIRVFRNADEAHAWLASCRAARAESR